MPCTCTQDRDRGVERRRATNKVSLRGNCRKFEETLRLSSEGCNLRIFVARLYVEFTSRRVGFKAVDAFGEFLEYFRQILREI